MQLSLLRAVPACAAIRRSGAQARRALRTAPVALRQAKSQAGESSNVPVRSSAPETGLALPGGSRFLSPFRAMQEMERELESFVRGFGLPALDTSLAPRGALSLAVDVEDKGSEYLITADVPGMDREDIKVEVSPDNVLTISGERKTESKTEEEGGLVRMERSYGSFARSFRLPDHVNVEGIKAQTQAGVLKLTVPKSEEAEAKKTIKIDIGGDGGSA